MLFIAIQIDIILHVIVDIEVINIECSYSQSSLKKNWIKMGTPNDIWQTNRRIPFPRKRILRNMLDDTKV